MPDSVRVAQSFLDHLIANDYAQAISAFDPNMRAAVNDVVLAQTWQQISDKFGKAVRHCDTRTARTISSNAEIVYLFWDFEKERLCVRAVIDSANQIIGLNFEAPVIR